MVESGDFRSNVLTICGAIGYVVFLAAGLLKILGEPVSLQLLLLFLFTSSALLGVDFGRDVFNIQITTRSESTDEGTERDN